MTSKLAANRVGVSASRKWLLRDIDLEIEPGEIVAIVGPNGAGKSTLLSVLAGDLTPATGNVTLDGQDLLRYPIQDLARLRAVLPQQTVIQFAFTSKEIVQMGCAPHTESSSESIAERMLSLVEADEFAGRVFTTLSIGEQARVSLARVLAQQTPILLLDEPTAALDMRHQQLVTDIARQRANEGATIAVVLHDLNLAAATADRIILMKDGRIVAAGTPWDTLNRPMLEHVFECHVTVTSHPETDAPLVLPLPGSAPMQSATGSVEKSVWAGSNA